MCEPLGPGLNARFYKSFEQFHQSLKDWRREAYAAISTGRDGRALSVPVATRVTISRGVA